MWPKVQHYPIAIDLKHNSLEYVRRGLRERERERNRKREKREKERSKKRDVRDDANRDVYYQHLRSL